MSESLFPAPPVSAVPVRGRSGRPGDVIYTGTSEGVSPVAPGDRLDGLIDGVGSISVQIGTPE
jgi:fumarylpyruvate hydrolase